MAEDGPMSSLACPPYSTWPSCVRVVGSLEELAGARFAEGVNAFCWPRSLEGDFAEIVRRLEEIGTPRGINGLEEEDLAGLEVSPAGKLAIDAILADRRELRELELWPELSCVRGYERARPSGPVVPEVYSWHVDSATAEADTWLCTYHGACSEGLRNDQARRKVDVPEIRAELLRMFAGEDGAEFAEWLNEECFDLHYAPLPGAEPYSFGLHNLWRIATEWDGSPVPPCVHRAPETLPGMATRLLLLS